MMEDRILQSMRLMAWERAKGELLSMLQTYYSGTAKGAEIANTIAEFIEEIENNL